MGLFVAKHRESGRLRTAQRWRVGGIFSCVLAVSFFSSSAEAGFSSFMPMNWGGSLTYSYGYVAASTESERMQLLGNVNVGGYVWQPWFATTSAALSLGLANTQTTTSSGDSNTITGSLVFTVFPRSRFPFSVVYTRTDSRTASFSDLTQLTGDTYHQIARLSVRQSYRSRGGSLSNFWYYRSNFSGANVSSLTETFGLTYQVQDAPSSLTLAANYSASETSLNSTKPVATVLSATHIYTPSPASGVTSLVSYINSDTGSGSPGSSVVQGSSSFSWRPEHRSLSVSGGVRASKSESGPGDIRKTLDTNIGLNLRMTRRSSITAGVSLGSSDNGVSQSLTSNQSLSGSYSSRRYPLPAGLNWLWQFSGSVGNTVSRVNSLGGAVSRSIRTAGAGLTHNLSGQWSLGRSSSINGGFSQSVSANKSSTLPDMSKTFNTSANFGGSSRFGRGSMYGSIQLSDSRTIGGSGDEATFQRGGVNLSQDLALSRLSSLTANISYDANRQYFKLASAGLESGYRQYANMSIFYQHGRPFGVYNLRFYSRFNSSAEIGSNVPSQRMDWDNRFQYRLGLLSTSASLRFSQNTFGALVKSINFQATRSF